MMLWGNISHGCSVISTPHRSYGSKIHQHPIYIISFLTLIHNTNRNVIFILFSNVFHSSTTAVRIIGNTCVDSTILCKNSRCEKRLLVPPTASLVNRILIFAEQYWQKQFAFGCLQCLQFVLAAFKWPECFISSPSHFFLQCHCVPVSQQRLCNSRWVPTLS